MSNLLLKADGDLVMIDQIGSTISMRQRLAHFSATPSSAVITGTNQGHADILDDYVLTSFIDHDDGTFTITTSRLSELAGKKIQYKNGFNSVVNGDEYQDSVEDVECSNSVFSFFLPQPFTTTCVTQIEYTKATNKYVATTDSVTFYPYYISNANNPPKGDPSAFTPLNTSGALPTVGATTLLAVHNAIRIDASTHNLVMPVPRSSNKIKRNAQIYDPTNRIFIASSNTYYRGHNVCYRGRAFGSPYDAATLLDYYVYYKDFFAQHPNYTNDHIEYTFGDGYWAEAAILYDPAT